MASSIRAAMVHPNFLHSNSTTHTMVFSAIAELIDNACDTDVNALDLWIDEETINDMKCLTFVDNGYGMTRDKLHKMLSYDTLLFSFQLWFQRKEEYMIQKAIGQYGNGFKSGSMRLGHDALVITRCGRSLSVGFLSQTYLKDIGAESILVPIVTWDRTPRGLTRKNTPENKCSIEVVLKYSPFKSEEELKGQLEEKLGEKNPGTKIVIFNLKKDNSSGFELDFVSDPNDIRSPETAAMDETVICNRDRKIQPASPEYKRSLRKYCTILYLKPRMRIFLRNVKVQTKWLEKSLRRMETDVYNPQWAATGEGAGVICVVQANFLEPIHNKQDFNETPKYNAFVNNAAQKLKEYYEEKTGRKNSGAGTSTETEDPWNWVQCDNCMSWRRLPEGYDADTVDKWFCYMNPDPHFNRCEVPEEMEGDDEEIVKPSYMKTVKKEKAEQKKLAKLEEERKAKEHEAALLKAAQAEEALKKLEAEREAARKAKTAGIDDALKKLTEAQQEKIETQKRIKAFKRREKKLEYINPEIAAEEKAIGDECFGQGKYEEAFKHYQEAVKRNPNDIDELRTCLKECRKKCMDSKIMKSIIQGKNVNRSRNKEQKATMSYGEAFELVPCGEVTEHLHTSQNETEIETQVDPQIEQTSLLDLSRKRKSSETVAYDSNQSPVKRPVRRNICAEIGTNDNTGSAKQPSLTNSMSCSSSTCALPSTDGVNSISSITCSYVPPGTAGTKLTSSTSSLFVPSSTDGANSSPDSKGPNSIQGRTISVLRHPAVNPSNNLVVKVEPTSSFETNTNALPKSLDSSMISISTATESKAGDTIKPENPDRENMQNLVTEGMKLGDQADKQHGLEGLLDGMDKVLNETNENKVFQNKEAQTDKSLWNGISPQEVQLMKSSIRERRQALIQKSEEFEKMKRAFDSFKSNVFTLLEKIDPGKDHGTEDNVDIYLANTIQRARNDGNEK